MRFGMVETKLGLAKILQNYKFTLDRTRTPIPIKIAAKNLVLTPDHGIFLKMEKL
jgi:cytochrome P450 family 6